MTPGEHPKKLIEVALPLDEINAACKADKDRKTGTIRNLHKWFAPMPLPAWRALLFAALIDDPADDEKRAYLLDVIKRLVANGADLPDEDTLVEAQQILKTQFPDGVPTVMDPFCGGGSTLVEAQRFGLPTFGSDLNPVPVLITRALTEILPKVYGKQPLHPEPEGASQRKAHGGSAASKPEGLFAPSGRVKNYSEYDGLIQDVSYYAEQIRMQAWDELKSRYPSQSDETPIAWLWARTAICPNPTCGIETILCASWWLSKKKGDLAWIQPRVQGNSIQFEVVSGQQTGEAPQSAKTGDGVFKCLGCSAVLDGNYLRAEGKAGNLSIRMTAVVVEKAGRRLYRAVTKSDLECLSGIEVDPTMARVPLNSAGHGMRVGLYGMETWDRLYTPRQLVALTTFADLVAATRDQVLREGGCPEWASAVTVVLGLVVGKMAQYGSSQAMIVPYTTSTRFNSAFARNDLPMTWDFYEANFFGNVGGTWLQLVTTACRALPLAPRSGALGTTARLDAREAVMQQPGLVATDPPYFDAIGYADLSDYFYLWHRRSLKEVCPDLYGTVAAPKSGELTASSSRHGGSREAAREFFIDGFTETFKGLQKSLASELPMLVVYASKEQKGGSEEETRWSSILTSMMDAGLQIVGTWPIHGTGSTRLRGMGVNAVATYVAMVCRPRPDTAGTCSLADFNRALRRELKPAVRDLQAAGILPVDLAQAAMGPGMQIYSRYQKVVDQTGEQVPVDQALRLINAALGEVLDEQEGELDADSRFAVAWWEKHGWEQGSFGEADQLARPQGISVDDLVRAGVATYPKPGYVGLLGVGGMDRGWKPSSDARPTAWEAVHHLADRLINGGGVMEAGRLIGELGVLRDPAQALVYRLHDIAAKKGRSKDQERYNDLIGSWSDLLARAAIEKDGLF
jgi:putative DNA methylase